jgi:hypothetical protein
MKMEEKKLEPKGIHSNPQQQYLYGFTTKISSYNKRWFELK